MRRYCVQLLALVVLLGMSAAASELRVAVATEPPGLDPTTDATAVIRQLLHHNLYEGLVQVNEDGELHPQLAESWQVSNDGLTYRFELREGVTFHDGTPLDAEVVAHTFRRAMDPETGHRRREEYEIIERINVVDELTVEFYLAEPRPAFLPLLALAQSVIVPLEADGLAQHPIGTGPFEFVEWRPADRLVLERNHAYYVPERPLLDRVEFHFIRDPASQRRSLLAGEVELVIEPTPEIALGIRDKPGFAVISAPSPLLQVLSINNSRPPFDELAVRQAIAHAVDRQQIIDLVFYGDGTPIGSHLTPRPPYSAFYEDVTGLYPHDPSTARTLLADAGYADGFSLTLTLPSNYAHHVRTGEVIADQLEEVGIDVRIELVDWGTWLERVYSQGEYDLTVIAHPGRLDPALMLGVYGPERPDYYFRRGWESEELNELLETGAVELDQERRQDIYARAQEILAQDVVNVYLQDMHAMIGIRDGVRGVSIYPIYALDLSQVSVE
ncbi:MAG: ABC transporter substrate-binding protein [Candidatus Bipolaricaulota bacterium]